MNVTLDKSIYEAAQRVAKARKRSLSDMVEYALRRPIYSGTLNANEPTNDSDHEVHWLERFHQQHLPAHVLPENPSDNRTTTLRVKERVQSLKRKPRCRGKS